MVDPTLVNAFSSPPPSLAAGEVHIWTAPLDVTLVTLAELRSLLRPAERDRANRFRFEHHRHRFIAGRGVLRKILGSYLEMEPNALRFDYGPHGKPTLASAPGRRDLHFNLAHSEGLLLLGVTETGPVGVDVERVRLIPDLEELVVRFFCTAEIEAFRKLPVQLQTVAFFNLWTRKEAWLKATGEGIAHLLNQVEVSFLPGEPARFVRLPVEPGGTDPWSLVALTPAPDFAAACAVPGPEPRVSYCEWDRAGHVRLRTSKRLPGDLGVAE